MPELKENCISAKSEIKIFLPRSKFTIKEKAQYLKFIFPKITFFHLSFAYTGYRNMERRLKFVFWEQEGVNGSLASVSLLTTQSNSAFAQSSLAVQTQPVQLIHNPTDQGPSQGCLIMEENRNSIPKLDAITRNNLASNASKSACEKPKHCMADFRL